MNLTRNRVHVEERVVGISECTSVDCSTVFDIDHLSPNHTMLDVSYMVSIQVSDRSGYHGEQGVKEFVGNVGKFKLKNVNYCKHEFSSRLLDSSLIQTLIPL